VTRKLDIDRAVEEEKSAELHETRNRDPRSELYREKLTEAPQVLRAIAERSVALLIIDMQYLDVSGEHGLLKEAPHELVEYYLDRLYRCVVPNTQQLLKRFRELGLEIIHTRIQSLTADGRDRSLAHKRLGIHAAPGSKEAEFLPEVAPEGDEIIINKTCSGVFGTTNIEYVLRNLGIKSLVVCGVHTNECVSTAVRNAADEGFLVTLVSDACAAISPEQHAAAIQALRDRYARVIQTEALIRELEEQIGADLQFR
jgi:nicotinamidase-related amidase